MDEETAMVMLTKLLASTENLGDDMEDLSGMVNAFAGGYITKEEDVKTARSKALTTIRDAWMQLGDVRSTMETIVYDPLFDGADVPVASVNSLISILSRTDEVIRSLGRNDVQMDAMTVSYDINGAKSQCETIVNWVGNL